MNKQRIWRYCKLQAKKSRELLLFFLALNFWMFILPLINRFDFYPIDFLYLNNMTYPSFIFVVTLLQTCALYGSLFTKSNNISTHSLPVNKKEIFVSNMICTSLYIGIQILFTVFLTKIFCLEANNHEELRFSFLAIFVVKNLIAALLHQAYFTLACVVSGGIIYAYLMSMFLSFLFVTFEILMNFLPYVTHANFTFTNEISLIYAYLQPLVYFEKNGIYTEIYFLVYLLLALGLFCLSYFLYQKRKEERTGESLVFKQAIQFMIFYLLFVADSVVYEMIVMAYKSFVFGILSFVIFHFLMYWILLMIAQRSIKVQFRWKRAFMYLFLLIGIFISSNFYFINLEKKIFTKPEKLTIKEFYLENIQMSSDEKQLIDKILKAANPDIQNNTEALLIRIQFNYFSYYSNVHFNSEDLIAFLKEPEIIQALQNHLLSYEQYVEFFDGEDWTSYQLPEKNKMEFFDLFIESFLLQPIWVETIEENSRYIRVGRFLVELTDDLENFINKKLK